MMEGIILAAIRGELGTRELPEFGERVDGYFTVIPCPVCGNRTLDNYDVCRHCGWEYDGRDGDHYSSVNRATLRSYRVEYERLRKTEEGNV